MFFSKFNTYIFVNNNNNHIKYIIVINYFINIYSFNRNKYFKMDNYSSKF